MNKNIKWRLDYLKEGWKYKPTTLLDYRFWIMALPEPIKNNFKMQSKRLDADLYSLLKDKYYNEKYFIFKLDIDGKIKTVKFLEPESKSLKYSFAGEFLDLIWPLLTIDEKNKIKNEIMKLKKLTLTKMAWERNKTIFHYLYYYPILKNKHWIFEGSYFSDTFNLDAGSVVYDVGAHLGLFSILAGVITGDKGKVYAFEPSNKFNKYIRKNAKLNNLKNIEIINVGLSDVSLRGYMQGMKFLPDKNGDAIITTIDKLYESNRVEKPNFIKMDIEGFERKALLGGMNLLKKSLPKLSICTYHLKDDHEVLKNIIIKINKNYKIKPGEYNKKYFAEFLNNKTKKKEGIG